MKKTYNLYLLLLLLVYGQIGANPTISFFFKAELDIDHIGNKLKKPGNLAKYTVKGAMSPSLVEGIVVTYGGHITASDYNGEVIFPRKHPKDAVEILITPHIIPVPWFDSTIGYWTRVANNPATVYSCEQKYNDKEENYYWDVEHISLSQDPTIPLATVIIIARPENVMMKEETTPTNNTANLVLPDVYIKKGLKTVENAAYSLTIRHLFKPVRTEEKRDHLKILTHVID